MLYTKIEDFFQDELKAMTMDQLRDEAEDEALNKAWRRECKRELEAREQIQKLKEEGK